MRRLVLFLLLGAAGFPAIAQSSMGAKSRVEAIISEIKEQYAPDRRQAVFDVKAYHNNDGALIVGGSVSDSIAYRCLGEALRASGVEYAESVVMLPYDKWAIVNLSVASLRTAAKHSAEMSTQATMGTPLRILEKDGNWLRVQCPDGYIAYIPSSSVAKKSAEEMKQWRNSPRFIVTATSPPRVYRNSTTSGMRDVVGDLVLGSIVEIPASAPNVQDGRLEILLPDRRRGFVEANALESIGHWASQDFDADRILDTAYSLEGTPYLWGGTSAKALDCSGLTKVSYFANGLILMRDASQQAETGTKIAAKDWRMCRPGDLLFFGNARTGKVTHVAIYDSNGNYVHSSGRVKRNSVDPDSEAYLKTPFLHAVRIAGNEESAGITRARNHPWYF